MILTNPHEVPTMFGHYSEIWDMSEHSREPQLMQLLPATYTFSILLQHRNH